MATVKPFAALRPAPSLAARVCELPYDVLSSAEARALAVPNPLSFFHVSKPEVDLEPAVDLDSPRVYEQGRRSFRRLVDEGALVQDPEPHYYVYRQIMGRHRQVGLVAVASCLEYQQEVIKKHELTRPDKEDDRLRHIETLGAQTGPAFLIYPDDAQLDQLLSQTTAPPPEVDFVAPDGVRHTSWTVRDKVAEECIADRFERMRSLYIADGHHRTAAASRLSSKKHNRGPSSFFLSVLFPQSQVQILPYHRLVKDLHGHAPKELLARLDEPCKVAPATSGQPARWHEVRLYLAGSWYSLEFRPELAPGRDPVEQLDVTLLQKHVLAPLLGIDDPRTSQRISFMGGIRGAGELERAVQSREYACAFALFPTSASDLVAIAEKGGIMPPKSTWFEPKLRDGMFCYVL